MDFQTQIKILYRNSRDCVKAKDAIGAYVFVQELLKFAQDTYAKQSSTLEKANILVFVKEWTQTANTLRDVGITDDVLKCFGLLKTQSSGNIDRGTEKTKSNVSIESQGWAADVFEKNKMAVVSIWAIDKSGTGFIISKNGYLLTNEHVIVYNNSYQYGGKSIGMSFADNQNKLYAITVMEADKKNDIALCRFDIKAVPNFAAVTRIKDYTRIQQGADVMVIGNALSMGLAPFTGNIRFTHSATCGDLVYTAPSNQGDSGGPVFIRNGECIGINKSRTEGNNLTNATPMDRVNEILNKWEKKHNIAL